MRLAPIRRSLRRRRPLASGPAGASGEGSATAVSDGSPWSAIWRRSMGRARSSDGNPRGGALATSGAASAAEIGLSKISGYWLIGPALSGFGSAPFHWAFRLGNLILSKWALLNGYQQEFGKYSCDKLQ